MLEVGRSTVVSRKDEDFQKVMDTGTMSERVMRGFREEEQKHGSAMFRHLPFSAEQIKTAWNQPETISQGD